MMMPPLKSSTDSTPHKLHLKDVLFLPIGCLLNISPLLALILLGLSLLFGSYVYFNANHPWLSFLGPDLSDLSISSDGSRMISQRSEDTWKIEYEFNRSSTFRGTANHISPIRISRFPMLTHDLLIVSGDFADPAKTSTSVANHHFTWRSLTREKPAGSINLLHVVPSSQEIYLQLLEIRKGDQVVITGREILVLNAFQSDGAPLGYWSDAGCNTLVVTQVEINPD